MLDQLTQIILKKYKIWSSTYKKNLAHNTYQLLQSVYKVLDQLIKKIQHVYSHINLHIHKKLSPYLL